jgi:hypothetical protein
MLFWCLLLLVTAACQTAPALVAPLNAPDSGYLTYRHPTGVFTIRLPSDWSIRDVSRESAVRVEFSPPGNSGLPLSVYVVNTGSVLDTPTLLNGINTYQSAFNGNPALYTEISRNAQGDGSWRLVGVRQTPIGLRQINTFFEADKAFLTVIEADLTDLSPERLTQTQTVINTYRVDTSAVLNAGAVAAIPADAIQNSASGSILFTSLFDWTDNTGGWNINGLLTNQSSAPIEAIRITAQLYDTAGRVLAEQANVVPNDVLLVNDTVPFTVRFRTGKPAQAIRYEIQASARGADYNLQNYLAPEQFIKGNEKATYNAQGFLSVSGDIVNAAKQPAKFIRVTVTVFDDQNQVVGVESAFAEKSELLPGDVTRYEVTFFQLAGSANRFLTKVEGRSN